MNFRHAIIRMSIGCLFLTCAMPLFAQAVFTVSSSSATGADIGVTELTGQLILSVSSGRTAAAPLFIHYSSKITNNSGSEISVLGNGGLSGIATSPVLDLADNAIRIDVPADAVAPSQVLIAGVRVDVTEPGLSNVTATISAPIATGNTILAGQETVVVLNSIRQPFTINFDADSIKLDNLKAASANGSIHLAEGYATAFSSAVGFLGQTVPTEIRFNPFPSNPHGVTITFARSATSPVSGASFTTLSGQDEAAPRDDGSTSVIYRFSGAADSDFTVESFSFDITVTVDPPAEAGPLTFQATLVPIGIAVPDSQFPLTDIPRYLERPLPDETDLQTGTVRFAIPFSSQDQKSAFTGIALTNPVPFRVKVNLAAYDAAGNLITGSGITNPVDLILPRNGQFARLASQIFGPGFNSSTSGTIVATAAASTMAGFYLEGGAIAREDLNGATADLVAVRSWVWPTVFHQGPAPATVLQMFNPGDKPATATLRLYDVSGTLQASSQVIVAPGGTQAREIGILFPAMDFNSLEGGYVTGVSDAGLAVSEIFGNSNDSNVLQGQLAVQRRSYLIPHFVTGAGYSTELSLVNMDPATTGQLTLTAFDEEGTPLGGGPVDVFIAPGNQYIKAVGQIFGSLGSTFTTGYIRVDLVASSLGPFVTAPAIAGSVRFTSAGGIGSTALPLFIPPSSDFVYSHVAQNLGYFSGVTVINPNATEVNVSLEVFATDGTPVGSTSLQLQPGQKISKLVAQFVPGSAGQLGGYVRVRSTLPVTSFSLFGTDDGKLLSAIPPQSVE
jgi:hypothetical protein